MAIYSRSSIQNTYCGWLWIGKNKRIIKFNKQFNKLDIDKIYRYAKDPYEKKYQYLINKREKVGLNHYDNSKAFMEYSNDMEDVYKNIED